MTPKQYLNMVQREQAKMLLENTDFSIDEIKDIIDMVDKEKNKN